MNRLQRQVSLVLGLVLFAVFGVTIIGDLLAVERGFMPLPELGTGTGGDAGADRPIHPEGAPLAPLSVAGAALVLLGTSSLLVAGWRESVRLAGREIGWWRWMNVGFCLLALGWIGPLLSTVRPAMVSGLVALVVAVATLVFGAVRLTREPPAEMVDTDSFPVEVATTVIVSGVLVIFSVLYVQLFFTLH
ncbi:hypothetical protein [Natrialba asiatica]|uniref:Uncharacterized protein n=1 Tax=Natrialba asiatica (strain ATCC 700177 / DSM 12278 / JCM 9576 / FERM P-10747 / NBRC 102637 / 172P1) TaxID=29540 RepID=M0AZV5_NATA1|nr:hypothetical protein [Natrialba asiatica]ELZ04050.1 hypothetical protein C481_04751 [Natrialba asiatica DSM 12278]